MYVYIMSIEPISSAYFMNPSHQSMSLCILSLLGNGSVRNHLITVGKQIYLCNE